MNVLVEEQCLRDIAESIRRKGGVTTTYKPREMSVAIDNLQTGGSGCLVKIEQSANQKITATYKGKTYTDDFFVLIGESFETSIKADNHYTAGTVNYNGTPLKGDITVRATQATEEPKYKVTIEQSANQTITATYDGKTYTSTFFAYEGSRITFAVKSTNADYDAGTLNYTEISSLNSDVTVRATAAKVTPSYKDYTFTVTDGNAFNKFCKFIDSGEEFTLKISSNTATIRNNDNFIAFINRQNEVYFEYRGKRVCTFRKSPDAAEMEYSTLRNLSSGAELTVRVG